MDALTPEKFDAMVQDLQNLKKKNEQLEKRCNQLEEDRDAMSAELGDLGAHIERVVRTPPRSL